MKVRTIIILKKKFLENLAFFLALNLLIKPVYVFGIDRVVQNSVGTEVYGSYFPLLNIVLIFQVFLDLGIENYTRKEVGSSPNKVNRLLPNIVVLKIILSVLFIAIFSVIGFLVIENQFEWRLLIILLINQSMASFILYMRANMGGLQLFKSETLVSVFDRFFMIIICGSILIVPFTKGNFKMEWFVLAQTLSYSVTLLISLFIVFKKTGWSAMHFSVRTYLPIFKRLWPFTLLTLLMAFYYRIDSIFLRFLLDDGAIQAGIYAHGFRILDFMSNYALIFSFILLPTFARMISRKENISSLLKLAGLALMVPAFAILTGVFFYRADVFSILYKEHIGLSANVFGIMIVSFFGICISYTFGALLTAKGCLKQLNTMAIIAVLISVILNLVLIPKFKVVGAAISNAIVQLFTIGFHVFVVKRKFRIKTNYLLILKLIAFLIVSFVIGYSISQTNVLWFVGVGLIFILSILFALFIKLLRVTYIVELLKTPATKF